MGNFEKRRAEDDQDAGVSRRVTRSMSKGSDIRSSFKVVKSVRKRDFEEIGTPSKPKKITKSKTVVTLKRESPSEPAGASQSEEDGTDYHDPKPKPYIYSDKPIAGVTSIETFGQPRGSWRLIRSEYTVPVGIAGRREEGEVVLIQNTLAHSLYALVVQAVLWNQTGGKQARPVLDALLGRYPDPKSLAAAGSAELSAMLYPIGLYNSRAKRLVDMARTWLERPPLPGRGYVKARDRNYAAVPLAVLDDDDDDDDDDDNDADAGPEVHADLAAFYAQSRTQFWEIAHLPGVGPYALDSFRIFHRDEMRGLAADWLGTGAAPGFEPEWKRVVPADKDLRAYLKDRWEREGWNWDPLTGRKKRLKI